MQMTLTQDKLAALRAQFDAKPGTGEVRMRSDRTRVAMRVRRGWRFGRSIDSPPPGQPRPVLRLTCRQVS